MVTRETRLRKALLRSGITDLPEEALPRLAELVRLLEEVAVPAGFISAGDRERIVERHVVDALVLLPYLEGSLIDVGSGAGLPGLVIAAVLSSPIVLVDAERKRVIFLRRAARELGLLVQVQHARAEDAGRDRELREGFDRAVARALAPPPVALELLLPFVHVGGAAVVPVGPSVRPQDLAGVAAELGGSTPKIVPAQVPGHEPPRWVMIVTKETPCPERYPRRVGVPMRKPLG